MLSPLSAVKVGIVVIYIVSGVIGGFFMGKIMKTQKFLWGFAAGAIYFCILFLISVLVKQGVSMEHDQHGHQYRSDRIVFCISCFHF